MRVIDGFRREEAPADIAAVADISQDELSALIEQLVRHGILSKPGMAPAEERAKPPPESRLIFFRWDLVNARPIVDLFYGVLRHAFSWAGAAAWLLLAATALFAVIAEPSAFADAFRSLETLSWSAAALLAVVIVLLKCWHELGHATALRAFAAAEGFDPGPIRAGLAFFAFLPFPYTDATAAWRIRSARRRAIIGMAGVYFESWAAAIAAVLWSTIRPGEAQTALFQLLVIAGFSTLLFNMNPLVRLDGYFIFSDLFGFRNLAPRSARNAQATGLRLLGAPAPDIRPGLLIYWLLSYAYRFVIFAGVFWLAYQLDPRLSWIVAAVGAMLLLVRPVWNMARMARRTKLKPVRLAAAAMAAAMLSAAGFVPFPDTVHIDGILQRHRAAYVAIGENARLIEAAAAPITGPGDAMRLESWTLDLQLAQLELERDRIRGALRARGARDSQLQLTLRAESVRVERQIAETDRRVDALSVRLAQGERWEPDAAPAARGAWISAYDKRSLGIVARPIDPIVRAHLDSTLADFAETLTPGLAIAARPTAQPDCLTTLELADFADAAGAALRGFRLDARVGPADPCLFDQPDGAAVRLRLNRGDAPLLVQLYNQFRRLAQHRLPVRLGEEG